MPRVVTSLVIADLSAFSRQLAKSLESAVARAHPDVAWKPGHVALQNLIARAAGFTNLQAVKAMAPPAAAPLPPRQGTPAPGDALTEHARRALSQFDTQGRLMRWPSRFAIQRLCMWPLWTHFAAKRRYTESEVNAILRQAHAFGDHATLRRELVNHRLLARESDCSAYWKLAARPDDEARALLGAWRRLHSPRP